MDWMSCESWTKSLSQWTMNTINHIRCPAPGRGVPRKQWDWSRLSKFSRSGHRENDNLVKRPMCREDFLDYFQNRAPHWQRSLNNANSCSMFEANSKFTVHTCTTTAPHWQLKAFLNAYNNCTVVTVVVPFVYHAKPLGLSEAAAQRKWTSMFQNSSPRRDQVDAVNREGEHIGKVSSMK